MRTWWFYDYGLSTPAPRQTKPASR